MLGDVNWTIKTIKSIRCYQHERVAQTRRGAMKIIQG